MHTTENWKIMTYNSNRSSFDARSFKVWSLIVILTWWCWPSLKLVFHSIQSQQSSPSFLRSFSNLWMHLGWYWLVILLVNIPLPGLLLEICMRNIDITSLPQYELWELCHRSKKVYIYFFLEKLGNSAATA